MYIIVSCPVPARVDCLNTIVLPDDFVVLLKSAADFFLMCCGFQMIKYHAFVSAPCVYVYDIFLSSNGVSLKNLVSDVVARVVVNVVECVCDLVVSPNNASLKNIVSEVVELTPNCPYLFDPVAHTLPSCLSTML